MRRRRMIIMESYIQKEGAENAPSFFGIDFLYQNTYNTIKHMSKCSCVHTFKCSF